MPSQKDFLLAQIGHMEGRVVTPELARQCRNLANSPVDSEAALVMQQIQPQLLIMFLRDLGGTKKYTIEDIDDYPAEFNLIFKQIRYKGKPALEFKLKEK